MIDNPALPISVLPFSSILLRPDSKNIELLLYNCDDFSFYFRDVTCETTLYIPLVCAASESFIYANNNVFKSYGIMGTCSIVVVCKACRSYQLSHGLDKK